MTKEERDEWGKINHPNSYRTIYQCTKCGQETVGRQNLCRCGYCMACHSKVKVIGEKE